MTGAGCNSRSKKIYGQSFIISIRIQSYCSKNTNCAENLRIATVFFRFLVLNYGFQKIDGIQLVSKAIFEEKVDHKFGLMRQPVHPILHLLLENFHGHSLRLQFAKKGEFQKLNYHDHMIRAIKRSMGGGRGRGKRRRKRERSLYLRW